MSVSRGLSFRQVLTCLVAGLLLLTGCELPERPTTICEWPESVLIDVDSPAPFSIIDDLSPTITWVFREEPTCVPAEYRVDVMSALDYLVGASAGYLVMSGRTATESFAWPADGPSLLPGNTYYVFITPYVMRDGELVEGGGGGLAGHFSTGPVCSDPGLLSAPNLHWPPDNWTVDPTGGMNIEWENTMSCWPADDFRLEISDSEDFSGPIYETWSRPQEGEWLFSAFDLPWTNCTRYYWRVRAEVPGLEDEPYSEVWSFFVQFGDTLCPIEGLGRPDVPVDVITLPSVRVIAPAACRYGPALDYPIVDYLEVDQSAPVEGRNDSSNWWYILSPNLNSQCWISGQLVDPTGNFSQVPIVPAPPLPLPNVTDTPAPFDCSQYATDPTACDSSNYCRWDSSVLPNGACMNR